MLFDARDLLPLLRIRSVPANSFDSTYCSVLGQMAVHGAMAGYSGITALRQRQGSSGWDREASPRRTVMPDHGIGQGGQSLCTPLVLLAALCKAGSGISQPEATATCQFMPSPTRRVSVTDSAGKQCCMPGMPSLDAPGVNPEGRWFFRMRESTKQPDFRRSHGSTSCRAAGAIEGEGVVAQGPDSPSAPPRSAGTLDVLQAWGLSYSDVGAVPGSKGWEFNTLWLYLGIGSSSGPTAALLQILGLCLQSSRNLLY